MFIGGRRGITPNISKVARKLVKSRPRCKRNGHDLYCDPLLLVIVYCYYQ